MEKEKKEDRNKKSSKNEKNSKVKEHHDSKHVEHHVRHHKHHKHSEHHVKNNNKPDKHKEIKPEHHEHKIVHHKHHHLEHKQIEPEHKVIHHVHHKHISHHKEIPKIIHHKHAEHHVKHHKHLHKEIPKYVEHHAHHKIVHHKHSINVKHTGSHIPDMSFDRKRIEERLRRIGSAVENEVVEENVEQETNKIANIREEKVNLEKRHDVEEKEIIDQEKEIGEVEEPQKETINIKEFKYEKGRNSDGRPDITQIKKYAEIIAKMKKEVAKSITGQEKIVNSLIMALLCDGHVLLEGVPGIAKTLAIKTLAIVSGCSAKRIQFTVDLLPTDITGIVTYTPGKGFETIKGPIFSNFVIADEINRSPSKTQSALIEAMQELQVTIGKETYKLQRPFFVMATENPIEQAGVYQLPEAQIDRFLFKLIMGYPEYDEESKIMEENITLKKFEEFNLKAATNPSDIMKMQALTKKIYLDGKIKRYILNIVKRTRTRDLKYGSYIEWGASPRASIALFIASKAQAFMNGRNFVIPSDVKTIAHDVLRHRIILTYRARAEHIDSDKIIDEILERENV